MVVQLKCNVVDVENMEFSDMTITREVREDKRIC
jgi:hypothetical protein